LAALDEEETSELEIGKVPSILLSYCLCFQENNQQKEDLNCMEEENIKNDLDKQANQGHQSYIEVWFKKNNMMEYQSLRQLYLIFSKSNHLIYEIEVHVKSYIASLHISLFVILMCTWLHRMYSYT